MIKAHQQFELFGKKTFEKAIIEPPFRMVYDMPNDACFYYITTGRASVYTPMEQVGISKEGIVLKCGTYLSEYLCDHDIEYCEAIAIHFYPDVLKMVYDHDLPNFLKQIGKVQPVMYEKVKSTMLVKNYIDNLQFYFDNPELVSEELLKLKMKELILLLAKTDNADQIRELFGSIYTRTEFDFKQVIEANLFNNLLLEELAALTHLSLSSFKREFAQHYGSSPAKYIKGRKLQQAAKLLTRTNGRISDAAFDSGFTDLAHFSKAFLKAFGHSPSEYRNLKVGEMKS